MLFREGFQIRFDIRGTLTSKYYLVDRDRGITFRKRLPDKQGYDIIFGWLCHDCNDRQIVLSGLDTFQISLFVWNILLKCEKKNSCNSIPQKSIDYLISYLDIFTLQKFDPTYLQAFLSIETIATLCNEIFPLKCSSSLRFYFSKFDFFPSFIFTYISSIIHVYIGALCWIAASYRGFQFVLVLVRWICSCSSQPSPVFSRNFWHFRFEQFLLSLIS